MFLFKWGMVMGNNFDVIKNYEFEDEEVIFNSSDFNECKKVCDAAQKKAERWERFAVYPSDLMLGLDT